MPKLPVGIIGCGYWGPNLVRNFTTCPRTEVVAVCDASETRLESLRNRYGHLRLMSSLDAFLDLPLAAVAVATPVSTHFPLVCRCLERGLHVLVEKPLAANVDEAQHLVDLAQRRQRILMVDHTYLFHNAVQLIKRILDQGELGDLYLIDSIRINLGLIQSDVSVVWDLAPHDLAIMDYFLGASAASICAWGCAHARPEVDDIAYINVNYGEQLMASVHVNWLSPVKIRQMLLVGSRKSLVFNELDASEPVKIYDRGIELGAADDGRQQMKVGYRSGDVYSPHIETGEALQAVTAQFAQAIDDGQPPLSDGRLGARVVRMLDAASESIRSHGSRIVLGSGPLFGVNSNARSNGSGQRHSHLLRCGIGGKRNDSLLCESLRVPDR